MWLCHTSGTLFVVKQINNTCKMYINVLSGPMKSGKVKEFCLMKRWCKGRSGLADNFFLFTVYIFSPCTIDFPLFPNKTPQLLESCWPITNEWLLGSFWTVFAQCCWWGGIPRQRLTAQWLSTVHQFYRSIQVLPFVTYNSDIQCTM